MATIDVDRMDELRCRVCGARGLDPCDLTKHIASICGFAAYQAREEAMLQAQLRAQDDEARHA